MISNSLFVQYQLGRILLEFQTNVMILSRDKIIPIIELSISTIIPMMERLKRPSTIFKKIHFLAIDSHSSIKNTKEMLFIIETLGQQNIVKTEILLLIWMLTIGSLEIKFFNSSILSTKKEIFTRAKEKSFGQHI